MEPNTSVNSVSSIPGQLEGPVNLFKSAWALFKANWKILISIIVAPMALMYIGQIFLVTGNLIMIIFAFILIIAGAIFSIPSQPAIINAIHRLSTEPGVKIDFKEQYKFGFELFWSLILLMIITFCVSLGSLFLLAIPGIIVVVYTRMYLISLTLDGKKGVEALVESYSLIKGRWWRVLGRLLFLILVYLVGAIVVFGIAFVVKSLLSIASDSTGEAVLSIILTLAYSAVLGPLVTVYIYRLYVSLKATRLSNVNTAGFKKWLIAFLIVGIVIFILIPLISLGVIIALSKARVAENPFNRANNPYVSSYDVESNILTTPK